MYVEAAIQSPSKKLSMTWAGVSQPSWLQFLEGIVMGAMWLCGAAL